MLATSVVPDQDQQKAVDERWSWLRVLRREKLTAVEIFLFGLMMTMGSQTVGWNDAYAGGFWITFSCLFTAGIGYLCLCLCLAEMASALPFSGGIYGYVRAISGPFAGYMVACFELLMNVAFVSAGLDDFKFFFINLTGGNVPIAMVFCYWSVLALCLMGGKPFWIVTSAFAVTTMILLLIYMLGAIKDLDLETYGQLDRPVTMFNFMSFLEVSGTQYMGIQYLPLLSHLCHNPRKTMPWLMVALPIICLITALWLSVAVTGHSPGVEVLSEAKYPLDFTFASLFGLSDDSDDAKVSWLTFPALYASVLALIFSFGRQLQSISTTGLLPQVFHKATIPYLDTPYLALIFGTVMFTGLAIGCSVDDIFYRVLYHLGNVSVNLIFIAGCVTYLVFLKNCASLQRHFHNPFKHVAAIVGIIIFCFNIASALVFQEDNTYIVVVILVLFFFLCVAFYVLYMAKYQKFSDEEKQHMFQAYLLNANKAKRERLRCGSGGTTAAGTRKGNLMRKHNSVAPSVISDAESQATSVVTRFPQDELRGVDSVPNPHAFELPFLTRLSVTGSVKKSLGAMSSALIPSPNDAVVEGDLVGNSTTQNGLGRAFATSFSNKTEYQELAILSSGGVMETMPESLLQQASSRRSDLPPPV